MCIQQKSLCSIDINTNLPESTDIPESDVELENGTIEKNWRKMGDTSHFSLSHFPVFLKPQNFALRSLTNKTLTALAGGTMGSFANHEQPLPQRLVQRLDKGGMGGAGCAPLA